MVTFVNGNFHVQVYQLSILAVRILPTQAAEFARNKVAAADIPAAYAAPLPFPADHPLQGSLHRSADLSQLPTGGVPGAARIGGPVGPFSQRWARLGPDGDEGV